MSAAAASLPRLSPARKRARRAVRIRRWVTVLILMSPWIIGFVVFTAYPMIASFYFSFTHYNLSFTI